MYQHDGGHSGRTPATINNSGPLYIKWAYSAGERIEVDVQPVISDGVVFFGSMNGEMHALNAFTGSLIWTSKPGGPIGHTAAVSGDMVYFAPDNSQVTSQ